MLTLQAETRLTSFAMDSLIQARNRAFVKQALAILGRHLAAGERLTRAELIAKTLACQPPCYYASHDRVSQALRILGPHPMSAPTSERRAMWLEIHHRVAELMNGPRHLRRHQAISFVLNFTRPSRFFISERTADRILGSMVRTRRYAYATSRI